MTSSAVGDCNQRAKWPRPSVQRQSEVSGPVVRKFHRHREILSSVVEGWSPGWWSWRATATGMDFAGLMAEGSEMRPTKRMLRPMLGVLVIAHGWAHAVLPA